MKSKFFLAGCFCLSMATVTFAQKGELNTAKAEYEKYEQMRGQKAMAAVAATSLKTAKASIDKAAAHEKTKDLPETSAYKALIDASLASQDSTGGGANFTSANAALAKAKQLDKDGKNKQLIQTASLNLAQAKLNEGVQAYNKKDLNTAFTAFEYASKILPTDTTVLNNAAMVAIQMKQYDKAIPFYESLLKLNTKNQNQIYSDLSSLYLMKKDTANALKYVGEGVKKFPKDAALAKKEIEISLQSGKAKELSDKINSAIAANPNDKTMHYYAGMIEGEQKNYEKAAEHYKKAIEIDPNYAEAYVNLGYVLITPGIDAFNAANKLPQSKTKEYAAAKAKAMAYFEKAKPYLEKGVELNPKSEEALNNLKTYYLAKNDVANANAIQKKIDALAGGAK